MGDKLAGFVDASSGRHLLYALYRKLLRTPEPGTTVHIPSPDKALLIYYVILVWYKVAVQPVYLSSGSVEGYSCITEG